MCGDPGCAGEKANTLQDHQPLYIRLPESKAELGPSEKNEEEGDAEIERAGDNRNCAKIRCIQFIASP